MYALSWLYVIADTGLQTYSFHTELLASTQQTAMYRSLSATQHNEKLGSGLFTLVLVLVLELAVDCYHSLIAAYKFADTFAWHSIASMALPALTVNRTVHFTSKVCAKYLPQFPRVARFAPAVVALSMIPFVIHPIDHATDWVFDRTVRQWYSDKL